MVPVYPASDQNHCPVHIFKKITPKVWHCDQPYGINKVKVP